MKRYTLLIHRTVKGEAPTRSDFNDLAAAKRSGYGQHLDFDYAEIIDQHAPLFSSRIWSRGIKGRE